MKSNTVRTSIVLDRKLVEAGLKATGLRTPRELVDFALRELLRHKQQRKLLSLKGNIVWEGDFQEMRMGQRECPWSAPAFEFTPRMSRCIDAEDRGRNGTLTLGTLAVHPSAAGAYAKL